VDGIGRFRVVAVIDRIALLTGEFHAATDIGKVAEEAAPRQTSAES
jgi:hypothetical protein